jgi:hypothetical protein
MDAPAIRMIAVGTVSDALLDMEIPFSCGDIPQG